MEPFGQNMVERPENEAVSIDFSAYDTDTDNGVVLSWSVGGDNTDAFSIMKTNTSGTTATLVLDDLPDYETTASYPITVSASDGAATPGNVHDNNQHYKR